jgi:transposase
MTASDHLLITRKNSCKSGAIHTWRHRCAKMVVVKDHQQQEPSMGDITTIGLDLAKSVFQVHAVDEVGRIVMRKRLRRSQVLAFFAGISPCLVGLEACATAHYWARELIALGHEARLMPPNYVKAYVKRNKHDVADAEAICEAVRRPSMRFVPVKTVQQQSALMMHRARDLLIRQRTMLVNALRAHLAEFGLIEAQGMHKVARLIAVVMDEEDGRVPDIARQVLKVIVNQIEDTQTRIAGLETQVLAWHKSNPVSQRLATIPGIGPIIATAIAATVAEPNVFRSGREFAAWLGLVPRQSSTGGKARLGGISKRGDSYLRRLLVNSAHTVLLCSKQAKTDPWLTSLLSRKPRLVVAVALANKTARVAWAIMSRQDTYRHAAVPA